VVEAVKAVKYVAPSDRYQADTAANVCETLDVVVVAEEKPLVPAAVKVTPPTREVVEENPLVSAAVKAAEILLFADAVKPLVVANVCEIPNEPEGTEDHPLVVAPVKAAMIAAWAVSLAPLVIENEINAGAVRLTVVDQPDVAPKEKADP
jgi:hypothetical protein